MFSNTVSLSRWKEKPLRLSIHYLQYLTTISFYIFFLDHSLCHRGPFGGQRMPSKWNQKGKIWNQSVLRIHEIQGHKLQPPVNSNGKSCSTSTIHSLSCCPIRYPACCRSTILRSSTHAVPTSWTQLQFPRTTQCLLNMYHFFRFVFPIRIRNRFCHRNKISKKSD